MIPKIIHYCWFGKNPYPPIIEKCINSWKDKLPDYELKKWDESNISIEISQFMKEAYQHKKYAFVSDYARYWILSQYGGIFLDTDVEVLKPLDVLLYNSCFFGFENHVKKNVYFVNPGLIIGCEANNNFIKSVLAYYDSLSFLDSSNNPNLSNTSPNIITSILKKMGLEIKNEKQTLSENIVIYPTEYFDPINHRSITTEINQTNNTYTIHHGAASWVPKKEKIKKNISIISRRLLGDNFINSIRKK